MKGTLDIAVDADDALGNGSARIPRWSKKENASRIGIGNGYKDALGLKAYEGRTHPSLPTSQKDLPSLLLPKQFYTSPPRVDHLKTNQW